MVSFKLQSSKKPNTKAKRSDTNEVLNTSPFEILCKESEKINPAILLAEELMRNKLSEVFELDDIELAQETLEISRFEIIRVEAHFKALVKTNSKAGSTIPTGF